MLNCIRCEQTKSETEFYKEKGRASGYRGYCKLCCAEKKQETRARKANGLPPPDRKQMRNPAAPCLQPRNVWARHIKAKFGITVDVYDAMLVKQEGRCAICNTDQPDSKHGLFSIDHCHTTGKIRGLLCQPCNRGLGQFRDSASSLAAAVAYLQQPH